MTGPLDGLRHPYLPGGLSYEGKFVATLKQFCQNPPAPVTVLQTDELSIISEDAVRAVFLVSRLISILHPYDFIIPYINPLHRVSTLNPEPYITPFKGVMAHLNSNDPHLSRGACVSPSSAPFSARRTPS